MISLFLHIYLPVYVSAKGIFMLAIQSPSNCNVQGNGTRFIFRVDCCLSSQQITVKNLKSRVKHVEVRMTKTADVSICNILTGIYQALLCVRNTRAVHFHGTSVNIIPSMQKNMALLSQIFTNLIQAQQHKVQNSHSEFYSISDSKFDTWGQKFTQVAKQITDFTAPIFAKLITGQ